MDRYGVLPDEFVFIESTPESWLNVLEVSFGILCLLLLLPPPAPLPVKSEEVGETEERLSGSSKTKSMKT